jgi:Mn-dependent DtxR family transcriptional regulator
MSQVVVAQSSEKRRRILEVLTQYITENGWAPTRRELAGIMGVDPHTVNYHLPRMRDDGVIKLESGPRQIAVIGSYE